MTFSSDLVFDGMKQKPYIESDLVNPLNVYGKSKAESEKKVIMVNEESLIIRTSAFFGPWDQYNFLHWVETNACNQIPIPVANDAYVSPTYVPDLVHTSLDLLIDDEKGIWHLANLGVISWYELAKEAVNRLKGNLNCLISMPLAEMKLQAPRPNFSVLESERAKLLPTLDSALQRYFIEKEQLIEML
jgi:dTDP-4-dehydrorhamnose reductase